MKSKEKAVTGLTSGIEFLFKKNNVSPIPYPQPNLVNESYTKLFHVVMQVKYEKGFGKITGPNEVTVDTNAGGQKKIKTKNIIIATGSEVVGLPFLPVSVPEMPPCFTYSNNWNYGLC